MTDRLIPDPVTARTLFAIAGWTAGFCMRTGTGKPRDWLVVEAYSLTYDNAVALWYAGDRPRGAEAREVPLG